MSERFDIFEKVTDTITDALENGTVPWRKPWNSYGDETLHRNFGTKRAYRGINQWLLELQAQAHGYTHPYWLTFKQAQAMGGMVRKGEKSTMVVFWKMLKVEDKDDDTKTKTIPMLRYFNVFNVGQVDSLEVPPLAERPEFDPIESAQGIIDNMPNAPVITFNGRDKAYYIPLLDEVHLPARENFNSPEAYYTTAFHELVHSTGHEKRLGRKESSDIASFGDEDYSREELTAELGAAMLSGIAGISPATIDNSAAYIANWLKALKNDRRMVVVAAGKAHAAADYILGTEEDHSA